MTTFSIITPTYKRADKLSRAIDSVLNQSYQNFVMIIVNDSPLDTSYDDVRTRYENDSRIHYTVNEKNSGANFSRNRGLSIAHPDSWVIFLDDDDYLAPEALQTFASLIEKHPKEAWFMCNRATDDAASLTHVPLQGGGLTYAWNFLIFKRYKGDATHCIKKSAINHILFPTTVHQGDEWLFFYELGTTHTFFYKNFNATLTDGYTDAGLNYRKRSTSEQLHTLSLLWKEGVRRNLHTQASFIAYMCIRFVRAFLKG